MFAEVQAKQSRSAGVPAGRGTQGAVVQGPGKAVQVDPMKPTLKAKRLDLSARN